MNIEKYFEKNSGIFTALAVFMAFMVLAGEKSVLLAFGGLFISFVLVSYLLQGMGKVSPQNTWGFLLFLGYNVLFIGMILYWADNYFGSIGNKMLDLIVLGIIVIFYFYTLIKTIIAWSNE